MGKVSSAKCLNRLISSLISIKEVKMSLADMSQAAKEELACSLSIIALYDAEAEISADNVQAALTASKNDVPAYTVKLFADLMGRGLDTSKFFPAPGAGGAAPAAAGAAAGGDAPAEEKKEEVEEEEADLGGGMDMFGGEDY